MSMEERASGIILRTRPLTETSLIVHWITREHGRMACVAKGARRPKSPFSGKLDLFYEADFSFVRSRKSELHNLREVRLTNLHPRLREDLARLNAAAYAAVLIEQGTETETPVPEYLELLRNALVALDQRSPGIAFLCDLEMQFLELMGATPPTASLSAQAATALAQFGGSSFAGGVAIPRPLQQELVSFLRRSVGAALERLPPQRERLLRALADQ